jgi:hypothetical protein
MLLDTLRFGFDVEVGRLPVVAGLLEVVVIAAVGLFRGESLALTTVGVGDDGILGCRSPPWRCHRGAPTLSVTPFPRVLRVKTLLCLE